MADDTHRQIDRAYDFADRVVEGVGRVLGVDVQSTSYAPEISTTQRPAIALPAQAREMKRLPAATAPAASPFEITEITDDKTGITIWVVTNGIERAECKSRAFADRVLEALTTKLRLSK